MNDLQILNQQQLIPIKQDESGQVIIDGRELHEFLKVQQDFSDWIKKQLYMIDAEEGKEFSSLKGETSEVGGRPTTEYVLAIDTAKEICMIAGVAPRTNEKTKKLSKQARQYFIQVEKASNSPEMIMKRALEIANKQVENLKLESCQQKQIIQEQQPKVIFADAVSTSHTSILVGELAKILKQNGIDMGQNKFFQWLRHNGYLIKRKGTDYNMPTQRSMEQGLFEIKETSVSHSDGHISVNKTSKVTGKGQQYFINKFLQGQAIQDVVCAN